MAATPTRLPLRTGPRRRLPDQKVNQSPVIPVPVTPSAQFMANAVRMVPGNPMGRMGRTKAPSPKMVNAPAIELAAGNDVIRVDARGNTRTAGYRAIPNTGGSGLRDTGPQNESPYGSVSGQDVRFVATPHSLYSAGANARTDAFQHGRLIAHDRHIIANTGRTTSSNRQQATGGTPNPEASGPPRPTWKMFNRTISKMYGADHTAQLDNNQYHAAVVAMRGPERQQHFTRWSEVVHNASEGQKFPLATQGQEYSIRYGGTPYLTAHRPYGKRGGFDDEAPLPTIRADSGGPYLYGTLLQVGAPGDGPQKIYGGMPWGLHSPTLPQRQGMQHLIRSRLGQVKPVWNVRPMNSNHAGQSWSQSMVSLRGQQAVKLQSTPPIRQPGMNSRWLGV